MNQLVRQLEDGGFTGTLRMDEPMSHHCSLRVGGPAALLAEPVDDRELALLMEVLAERNLPWLAIGGGTNLMFPNSGYPGCAVRLGAGFSRCEVDPDGRVLAGAALPTGWVMRRCTEAGLAGLEFAAGIPGSLGGAIRMNAGTREGDMARIVAEVNFRSAGGELWVPAGSLGFRYRHMDMPEASVITAVRLKLSADDPGAIRARITGRLESRRLSQPLDTPSAGCWFKNPHGDSAGRLIDAAGLKGQRVGGAEVSRVHANFFVNRGDATAQDFDELAEMVRKRVQERFGVRLEEEVHIVRG